MMMMMMTYFNRKPVVRRICDSQPARGECLAPAVKIPYRRPCLETFHGLDRIPVRIGQFFKLKSYIVIMP